jgi:hypothetical protein
VAEPRPDHIRHVCIGSDIEDIKSLGKTRLGKYRKNA